MGLFQHDWGLYTRLAIWRPGPGEHRGATGASLSRGAPRAADRSQKLEEAGRALPADFRGSTCSHLDSGFLVSRPVRQ